MFDACLDGSWRLIRYAELFAEKVGIFKFIPEVSCKDGWSRLARQNSRIYLFTTSLIKDFRKTYKF